MKKITVILCPFKYQEVTDEFKSIVEGVTVTEVKGCGRSVDPQGDGTRRFIPRIKIETVVTDDQVAAVLQVLKEHATVPGEYYGDALVYIEEVEQAVRIRTGEQGPAALS